MAVVGDIVSGRGGKKYKFLGGDSKEKSNWEAVDSQGLQTPIEQSAEKIKGPTDDMVKGFLPRSSEKLTPLNLSLDVASAPGRYATAAVLAPFRDDGKNFQQSAAETEGLFRDPALIPSLAIGGPAAKIGTKVASRIAGPFLKKAVGGAVTGGVEGAVSAGIHQVDRISQDKGVDLKDFALESLGSAALPVGGVAAGDFLKKKAAQIIQTTTKLSRKIKNQKVMNKEQLENYFDNYASWRGLKATENKLNKHHEELNDKFDDLINKVAKGEEVDLKAATIKARNNILKRVKDGEVSVKDLPSFNKTIDEFEVMTQDLLNKNGKVDIKVAQNFKRSNLDPISKFDKPSPIGITDPNLPGQAKAARAVRRELTGQMEKELPDLKPLNKEFGEMASVRPFIESAVEKKAANRGLSLQDLTTLGLAGLGTGGAALAPFAISRGQKSTGIASLLKNVGESLSKPGRIKSGTSQIGRSSLFRNKE